jgi:hypothetical protein
MEKSQKEKIHIFFPLEFYYACVRADDLNFLPLSRGIANAGAGSPILIGRLKSRDSRQGALHFALVSSSPAETK